MAYIKDLSTLELDSYTHKELEELAIRIMAEIQGDGAWNAMQATNGMNQGGFCMLAVRRDPDQNSKMQTYASFPQPTSFEHGKSFVLPMLAAMGCELSSGIKKSGEAMGIGMMGVMEMYAKVSTEMHGNGNGGDGGAMYPA